MMMMTMMNANHNYTTFFGTAATAMIRRGRSATDVLPVPDVPDSAMKHVSSPT
eukprot:NODE_3059_length_836_cov_1.873239.p4 GENE.NODE_3059_length_836_cov_1.873239~~NODE_3059_length_836_cov_1.873239.p4  ORF type:complete len:53 (-),score=4.65 NODE_3059_length_836_cov_1.873239:677-835(-)